MDIRFIALTTQGMQNKICSIKELRACLGTPAGGLMGLKEAKDIVENLGMGLPYAVDCDVLQVGRLKSCGYFMIEDVGTCKPVAVPDPQEPEDPKEKAIINLTAYAKLMLDDKKFEAATSVCNLISILNGIDAGEHPTS